MKIIKQYIIEKLKLDKSTNVKNSYASIYGDGEEKIFGECNWLSEEAFRRTQNLLNYQKIQNKIYKNYINKKDLVYVISDEGNTLSALQKIVPEFKTVIRKSSSTQIKTGDSNFSVNAYEINYNNKNTIVVSVADWSYYPPEKVKITYYIKL